MAWKYASPFVIDVKVQDADIDNLDHTNNTCYINWCERAAWHHSESLGLSVDDYQSLGRAMVLHRAEYEYFLPSFLNENLQVATWLTSCDGKLRLERQFQIINSSSNTTLLQGVWSLVCINLATGKPAKFPAEFRNSYANKNFPLGSL